MWYDPPHEPKELAVTSPRAIAWAGREVAVASRVPDGRRGQVNALGKISFSVGKEAFLRKFVPGDVVCSLSRRAGPGVELVQVALSGLCA